MAWCLMAPSHFLNQCWLVIDEVMWHSPGNRTLEKIKANTCMGQSSPCSTPDMHQLDFVIIADVLNSLDLTHHPRVPHICVIELGEHWFRKWLVPCSAPSHYLNQCCLIVDWTLRNKLQWNFYQNTKFFIHENALVNVLCEMAVILSRGRWVKL